MSSGQPAPPVVAPRRRTAWLLGGAALLLFAGVVLLLWGLNMRRGLNHDEHQFVASAALIAREGLLPYRDFAYFHVPTLSLIYAFLFQFTPYLLLAARSFSVVCSGLLLALLLLVAFAWLPNFSPGQRLLSGFVAVALLIAAPSFIHASGRAWNHDLPVLLTAAAACLQGWWLAKSRLPAPFISPSPRWLVIAGLLLGLAAGVRSSFALVALPFALSLLLVNSWRRRRFRLALLWLGLGGLIGAAPTLYFFVLAPDRFLFGNFTYAQLNTLYYGQLAAPPPAMTLAGKALAALQFIVLQPGNLLLVLPAVGALWRVRSQLHPARAPELLFSLLLLPFLLAGAFAPTPLQEQYLYPLLPWCAFTFLAALRYEKRFYPLMAAASVAACLAFVLAAPRYWEGAEVALNPAEWNPLKVHARGERLAQLVAGEQVLTLAPIFALEGHAAVYPELVAGPLGFRVAPLLTPEDRKRYGLVAPQELDAHLAGQPPRAVFTGVHDSDAVEEQALVAFAQTHGYVPIPEEEPALLWARPLETWGGAIRLGAVDLPLHPLAAGEQLLLIFYEQAVQPLDRNWNVLVRLVAPDGVSEIARSEGWPWGRPTRDWEAGAVWPDGHVLDIPSDAAPGPYRVEISFYDPETLDLLGDGPAGVGYVVVSDGGQPLAAGSPPLAQFGGCIDLLAVDPSATSWTAGADSTLQLTWQRTAADCGRYTMFVHLTGPDGLVAQRDQEPLQGFYPTDRWLAGAPVSDAYSLSLPPDLPAGQYQLLVGLYDPLSGTRVPLMRDGIPAGDAYVAGAVTVE